jgi:glycosyltransferase involved in cell wall biosynthesis
VKNGKTIIILTSSYPYNTEVQEAFLIEEVNSLAKLFSKVIVCPPSKNGTISFELPDNVIIEELKRELTLKYKLKSVLEIFGSVSLIEIIRGFGKIKGLKDKLKFSKDALAFRAHSERMCDGLKRTISKHNVDIQNVLGYSYWMNECALALVLLKKNYHSLKSMSRIHSSEMYLNYSDYNYRAFKEYLLSELDYLVPISQYMKNYLLQNYNYKKDNVFVHRLGTVGSISDKDYTVKTTDTFNIVSIGSANVKRVELVEQALRTIDNVRILWHHYGSENYQVQKGWLSDSVECEHIGYLPNKELLKALQINSYDLLVNVSSSEGIPVSIMEAFSVGIPCIATTVGGTPEIVNNENGYLLPENPTPDEVVSKIEQYFNLSTEEKNKKRKAAYDTWNTKYNAEKNYTAFVDEILSL